jgi:hypothetical protein
MYSGRTVLRKLSAEPVLDLEHLVARFIASTLPRVEWTHLAHLAVGLWHVDRCSKEEALDTLRDAIRKLNDSHGTINSASSGYHETITRAYVQLLAEFNERCTAHVLMPERVSRLFKSKLAQKDALLNFYSRAALMSGQARADWVAPDLAPIRLGRLDTEADNASSP